MNKSKNDIAWEEIFKKSILLTSRGTYEIGFFETFCDFNKMIWKQSLLIFSHSIDRVQANINEGHLQSCVLDKLDFKAY